MKSLIFLLIFSIVFAKKSVVKFSDTFPESPIFPRCETYCQKFWEADGRDKPTYRSVLNKKKCSCDAKCGGLCYALVGNGDHHQSTLDFRRRVTIKDSQKIVIQDWVNEFGCTCGSGSGLGSGI